MCVSFCDDHSNNFFFIILWKNVKIVKYHKSQSCCLLTIILKLPLDILDTCVSVLLRGFKLFIEPIRDFGLILFSLFFFIWGLVPRVMTSFFRGICSLCTKFILTKLQGVCKILVSFLAFSSCKMFV